MMRHLGGPMPLDLARERFQKWLDIKASSDFGPCVISFRGQPEIIGAVGVFPNDVEGESVYEIGWWVLPEHQNKGIAFEAAEGLDRYAATRLKPYTLTAFPNETNIASNRICEKLGMKKIKLVSYPYGNTFLKMTYWRRNDSSEE